MSKKIVSILIITLLLLVGIISPTYAATDFEVSGGGGDRASGSDDGSNTSSNHRVWSVYRTGSAAKFTTGNWSPSFINKQKNSELFSDSISCNAWDTKYYHREAIAYATANPIYWYQVYISEPNTNDNLGIGKTSIFKEYAPKWGENAGAKDNQHWPQYTVSYRVGPSGKDKDKGKGANMGYTKLYDGAQSPEWNNTMNYDKKNVDRGASYNGIFTLTDSSLKGSKFSGNLGNIVNDNNKNEGRYSLIVSSERGRGQNFNSTATGLNPYVYTAFFVQRPRVRVNIVDEKTGKPIQGATWKLNNTYNNVSGISGTLVGSNQNYNTDGKYTWNDNNLVNHILAPAVGEKGTQVLPLTGLTKQKYTSLQINVPGDYTFKTMLEKGSNNNYNYINNVEMWKQLLGSLKSGGYNETQNLHGNSINNISVSADGNTITFKGNGTEIPIARFYEDQKITMSESGFYDITIKVAQRGPVVKGTIYKDNHYQGNHGNYDSSDSTNLKSSDKFGPALDNLTVVAYNEDNSVYIGSTPVNINNGSYSLTLPNQYFGKKINIYVKKNGNLLALNINTQFNNNYQLSGGMFHITEPNNNISDVSFSSIDCGYAITLPPITSANTVVNNKDFGICWAKNIKVMGKIYNEKNGNGKFDFGKDVISASPHEIYSYAGNNNDSITIFNKKMLVQTAVNNKSGYVINFSFTEENLKIGLYMLPVVGDIHCGLNQDLADVLKINKDTEKILITQPNIEIKNARPNDHQYNLTLGKSGTSQSADFAIYYNTGTPSLNKEQNKIETDIKGPSSWLNSNKLTQMIYVPTRSENMFLNGKILKIKLEKSELWYPYNPDFIKERINKKDKNIQPIYIKSDRFGTKTEAKWAFANADVPSKIINPTFNDTYGFDNKSDLINSKNNLIYKKDNNGGKILNFGKLGSGSSSSGIYGTKTLDGGNRYFGISVYYVTEYDPFSEKMLNKYYKYGTLANKTVKVYSSTAVN